MRCLIVIFYLQVSESEEIIISSLISALKILLIKNFVFASQTCLIALDLKNFAMSLFLEFYQLSKGLELFTFKDESSIEFQCFVDRVLQSNVKVFPPSCACG